MIHLRNVEYLASLTRGGSVVMYSLDTFEQYANGSALNGLNKSDPGVTGGGGFFSGPYVERNGAVGVQAQDDFESYTNGANLNGLNGGLGSGWAGAYVVH